MNVQHRLISVALISALIGCAFGAGLAVRIERGARVRATAEPTSESAREDAGAIYTRIKPSDLPGWTEDSVAQALPALKSACLQLRNLSPDTVLGIGPIARPVSAWANACAGLGDVEESDATLRADIERLFVPYRITAATAGRTTTQGLFTGYYEAELNGSLVQTGAYQFPVYGPPRNLITADVRDFLPKPGALPAGVPPVLIGRLEDIGDRHRLRPYYTREQIDDDGAINTAADVLFWADDPVAVHILHVQGSGRVNLTDGQVIRVGFAGSNGFAFRAIAKVLVEAGELQPDAASMTEVRDWLHAHPDQARTIMNRNARYIFFRRTDNAASEGPIGSLGVALTPGRSLAVDPRYIPLGAPVWLDTIDPDGVKLQRLVVAEDVGNAITGPVRGDYFWGHGEEAFQKAGRMRSAGAYYVFVPRTGD